MAAPADEPEDSAPNGAATKRDALTTTREALVAELLGDAHRLLQRLEAMEQRIQTLSLQIDARSDRFEAHAARYAKALGELHRATTLRRDQPAMQPQPPSQTSLQPVPVDATAAAAPFAPAAAPPPAVSDRPPFWQRHATAISVGSLVTTVLAGLWAVVG
jgi:hypothetical protein